MTSQQHHHHSVHLFVLQHGLYGSVSDMQHVDEQLYMNKPADMNLLTCRVSSTSGRTFDGIETLGELNAREVVEFCKQHKLEQYSVIYLSMIGHSLGGLINRNSITWLFSDEKMGNLYRDNDTSAVELRKEFAPYRQTCKLVSYTSLVSPHMGSRRAGGRKVSYKSLRKNCINYFLNSVIKQSGKELGLRDEVIYNGKTTCLLSLMSDPEGPYLKILKQFEQRTAVGATHYDIVVPLPSATIRSHNPYKPPKNIKTPQFRIMGYSGFEDDFIVNDVFKPHLEDTERMKSVSSPSSEKELKSTQSEEQLESTDVEIEEDPIRKVHSYGDLAGTEHTEQELQPSVKSSYFRDNYYDAEYKKEILDGLQSAQWRRLDVEFRLQSAKQITSVHILPIKKVRNSKMFDYPVLFDIADECINVVTKVSLKDHQESILKYNKTPTTPFGTD
jgi:hypothetical protein